MKVRTCWTCYVYFRIVGGDPSVAFIRSIEVEVI
jgi:hypothetical protein